MAIKISFGIQKGGVGKTTTVGIVSHLLSKEAKVLAVDFDSQGNLTHLLSRRSVYDFQGKSVLEGLVEKNASKYIYKVDDNLDILPAEDTLITLTRYLYRDYKGHPLTLLKETLEPLEDLYDYIIFDLPPNLGEHTLNALVASDFTIPILQTEPFCWDALPRYLETIDLLCSSDSVYEKAIAPDLKILGILATMSDVRSTTDKNIYELAKEDYKDLMFDTIIKRRSRIKDFSLTGISEQYANDREGLEQYYTFVEELKKHVGK
ncbi:ParA family protein [Paenibacillus anaericanus]|uniref:ParA family protein n=1 Tax=Paenibacillus anaericanus TaxID=170367 RepID=A0A3S1JY12_9BACL|nr:ParA family protein [Paenibacillus anaericanus]RUT39492.1 ParA family protein [Paenibacillus anaericanus]